MEKLLRKAYNQGKTKIAIVKKLAWVYEKLTKLLTLEMMGVDFFMDITGEEYIWKCYTNWRNAHCCYWDYVGKYGPKQYPLITNAFVRFNPPYGAITDRFFLHEFIEKLDELWREKVIPRINELNGSGRVEQIALGYHDVVVYNGNLLKPTPSP